MYVLFILDYIFLFLLVFLRFSYVVDFYFNFKELVLKVIKIEILEIVYIKMKK